MAMKNRNVIDKGPYTYSQPGSFVEIKDFIITEKDGERYLLLRIKNNSQRIVDGVKLTLIQLDSSGNVISSDDHFFDELKVRSEGERALGSGLMLKKECTSFRVHIQHAVCDNYKFVFKKGQCLKYFDPRGYGPGSGRQNSGRGTENHYPRQGGMGRIYGLIAFVSVLFVVMACLYVAFMNQDNFGKRKTAGIELGDNNGVAICSVAKMPEAGVDKC